MGSGNERGKLSKLTWHSRKGKDNYSDKQDIATLLGNGLSVENKRFVTISEHFTVLLDQWLYVKTVTIS